MLVLGRRVGEKILINDNIVVTVIEVRGDGRVRLGFDAPMSVRIVRDDAKQKKRNRPVVSKFPELIPRDSTEDVGEFFWNDNFSME